MSSEDSCIELEGHHPSLETQLFAEDEANDREEPSSEARIVAVYNGKVLHISEELLSQALSGISVKHYDGNCLPPEEPFLDDHLFGEDYLDFEDEEEYPVKIPSRTMSSMIRLCYEPKKRGSTGMDNEPEDTSDYQEKPPCLQEQINFRNSFWNLHRPDLCKLTWPHAYVGEAIVTEHLHRHLKKHGEICEKFHAERDLTAMLDKELDFYDKLKIIQSPKKIPPDEGPIFGLGRKGRKSDLCKTVIKPPLTKQEDDDDLEPSQVIHPSKEEFCITIGRPIRKLREERSESQIWLPYGYGEVEAGEYSYQYYCSPSFSSDLIHCEAEGISEMAAEEEPVERPEPIAWVEPDYCAMI